MLVLSRKRNESITIPTSEGVITITLIAMGGGKCRIGVEAPRSITVHREEVAEAIRDEIRAKHEDDEPVAA